MGIVYRGEDPRLDRPSPSRYCRLARPLARPRTVQSEARVCARLDHPYILKIYDYGQEEETYHIVMEYVEGITLREVIGDDPRHDIIDVPRWRAFSPRPVRRSNTRTPRVSHTAT